MRRLPNILRRGFSAMESGFEQQFKSGELMIDNNVELGLAKQVLKYVDSGELRIDNNVELGLAKQVLKYVDTENIPLSSIYVCKTGDSAAELAHYVAPLLAKDTATISSLFFNKTKIGDSGIAVISEALKYNRSVDGVYLNDNDIGFTGVKSLTDMLCQNKKLRTLSLGYYDNFYNHESPKYDDFISDVAEALKHNSNLETLRFSFYLNTPKRLQILTEALDHNFVLSGFSYRSDLTKYSDPDEEFFNKNNKKLRDTLDDFTTITKARIAREGKFHFIQSCAPFDVTQKIILEGATNPEIAKLVDYWHLPLTQHESQKLRSFDGLQWTPLFGEKEITLPDNIVNKAGWKIVARTNSKELEAEGRNLRHCVGGYTSHCLNYCSHIISIVDDENKPDSTIEIKVRNNNFHIAQHFGSKNTEPSENSKLVLKWLEQQLASGDITINYDQLEQDRIARNMTQNTLKNELGFDPLDDKEFNNFVRTFKRKILPSGAKYKIDRITDNFDNFLSDVEVDLTALYEPTETRVVKLKSLLHKDQDQELKKKINFGIQGSVNKICGKEKAVSVSINADDQVRFSSKDSAALEILKKMFGENIGQEADGSLVVKNLAALEVRKIVTQEAARIRSDLRELKSAIPATKVSNQSSESLSKDDLSLTK